MAIACLLLLGTPAARLIRLDEPVPMLTREQQKQIIWLPRHTLLPEVSAHGRAVPIQTAKGNSRQAISTDISSTPKQFVWVPEPQAVLPNEVRSPNLIAVKPAPAPPVRPEIKPFQVPDAHPAKASKPPVPLELPRVDLPLPKATAVPNLTVPSGPERRAFVPPPVTAAKYPQTVLDDVPDILRPGPAPNVNAAIVGLTPANVPVAVPEGSRSGALHTGVPDGKDRVTSGAAAGSPVVPGLTVRGVPGAAGMTSAPPPPLIAVPPPSRAGTGIPDRPFRNQSVSVAYWPNARHLSPVIETRFRTRVVYATVLAAPKLTPRIPDWTLWFAEVQPGVAGAQPLMRPPVALSNYAPQVPMIAEERENATIRIAGILHKTGILDSVVPIQGKDLNLVQGIVDALNHWQFYPAFRDGVAVDIEVVIEVSVPLRPPPAPVANVR